MLSISHLIIIIIAALIFLGPDKIPQFLKSCGEGIVLFKKTLEGENKPPQKSKKTTKKVKKKNKTPSIEVNNKKKLLIEKPPKEEK